MVAGGAHFQSYTAYFPETKLSHIPQYWPQVPNTTTFTVRLGIDVGIINLPGLSSQQSTY
jgi:hypothetical protein